MVGVKGLTGHGDDPGRTCPSRRTCPSATLTVKADDLPTGPVAFAIQGKATIDGKPVMRLATVGGGPTAMGNLAVPPRPMLTQLGMAITEKPPFTLAAKFDAPVVARASRSGDDHGHSPAGLPWRGGPDVSGAANGGEVGTRAGEGPGDADDDQGGADRACERQDQAEPGDRGGDGQARRARLDGAIGTTDPGGEEVGAFTLISIYTWRREDRQGLLCSPEQLPAPNAMPDVLWIDLENPTAEEEELVFEKFFPSTP